MFESICACRSQGNSPLTPGANSPGLSPLVAKKAKLRHEAKAKVRERSPQRTNALGENLKEVIEKFCGKKDLEIDEKREVFRAMIDHSDEVPVVVDDHGNQVEFNQEVFNDLYLLISQDAEGNDQGSTEQQLYDFLKGVYKI